MPPKETEKEPLFSKRFAGKTIKEAEAAASAAIPKEEIVEFRTVKDVKNTAITVTKYGEEETIKAANGSLRGIAREHEKRGSFIFDIGPVIIVEKGTKGTFETQAYSEMEAYGIFNEWSRHQDRPKSPHFDELKCSSAPTKGFAGIGKKKGLWKVHWSTTPFTAEIKYREAAVVETKYRKALTALTDEEQKQLFAYKHRRFGEMLFSSLLTRMESENRLYGAKRYLKSLRKNKEAIIQSWAARYTYTERIADYFISHETQLDRFCQLILETISILELCGNIYENKKAKDKVRENGREFLRLDEPSTGIAGGTIGLMLLCYQIVLVIDPYLASPLDHTWHGIGDWMA